MCSVRVRNIILAGSVAASLLASPACAASEVVLYSFGGFTGDGISPVAGLIDVGGALYGATQYGGASNKGTVFKLTGSGVETVLHSFGSGSDGAHPYAGLIHIAGTLYGTTYNGGASNKGTVFKLTRSGVETALYSFRGGSDGAHPYAGLIHIAGTLYGTTYSGGASNKGTVFKLTGSGVETVLHSFGSGSDGVSPQAGLAHFANTAGTLYGTTSTGGGTSCDGTVFKVTTTGVETVLYCFNIIEKRNGFDPVAGLIDVGGALYGTTQYGGGGPCGIPECGAVFKVTTTGVETVLHSFGSFAGDGINPVAGLIAVGGVLYGTTSGGGTLGGPYGAGTVFTITTAGSGYKVLHSFGSGSDGVSPQAGLISVGGTLYGTTAAGGTYGKGTVFKVTP